MGNIEQEIKKLQDKNQEIKELQTIHCNKKADLSELEANLYLFGEDQVKEALGKEKVSQKDKEYFVQLKTLKLAREVDTAYLNYKYAQEEFKILKLKFRAEHGELPPL